MKTKQQNAPLNILLADDDIDDRIFFKAAIEKLQLPTQLTTVHDGEQLMDHLSKNLEDLPDVLFLDINMPRKNGFECLSEMKHDVRFDQLPVVMFSTNRSQDTIVRLFKSGVHIYITKPGDFAQLVQVIHHALSIAAEQMLLKSKVNYILNA